MGVTVSAPAVSTVWYAPWSELLSFRPPKSVQDYVDSRSPGGWSSQWSTQRIEAAFGPVNIDYYPVTVKKLPHFPIHHIGGLFGDTGPPAPIPMNADDLLYYIRTTLIDSSLGFQPYSDKYGEAGDDGKRWLSTSPINSVISIVLAAVDDGSVVCSEADNRHWRLTTIYTTKDEGHAVSGTREWGYFHDQTTGNYIYYTRGNDRMTRLVDNIGGNWTNIGWSAADKLWKILQSRIYNHVTALGGDADIGDSRCATGSLAPYYKDNRITQQEDWKKVSADIYRPTGTWYYKDPIVI